MIIYMLYLLLLLYTCNVAHIFLHYTYITVWDLYAVHYIIPCRPLVWTTEWAYQHFDLRIIADRIMKNLILEKNTYERSDAGRNYSSSSTCGHTENPRRTIVDLRQSLRDKISKNEIFCSFEIVSTRRSGAFYRRSVEWRKIGPSYNTW